MFSPTPQFITTLALGQASCDIVRHQRFKAITSWIDERLLDVEWVRENRQLKDDNIQAFEFEYVHFELDQETINAVRLYYVRLGWRQFTICLYSESREVHKSQLYNLSLCGPL